MGALATKSLFAVWGQINGADGATNVAGSGNWSAVRNGAGDYTVTTQGDGLVDATRCVVLACSRVISTMVAITAQTDSTIQFVVVSDVPGATDSSVDFLVIRTL
jgi:hypothetical protein